MDDRSVPTPRTQDQLVEHLKATHGFGAREVEGESMGHLEDVHHGDHTGTDWRHRHERR
jgi:hypothetical protein